MNIRTILEEMGYELFDKGKEFRCRPIYRDSDNPTSLRINKSTGNWNDFGIGIKGKLEDLIKITVGDITIEEAKEHITKKGINFDPIIQEEIEQDKRFDITILEELKQEHRYWINRGISKETLLKLDGGIIQTGRLKNRYVFPIFNTDKKKIIGLAGRALSQSRAKWKILGSAKKFQYPYFLSKQQILEKKEALLVESIGDYLSLLENGIENALVMFGIDVSNEIINILLKSDPNKIFVCFNNDINEAGNKAAEKAKRKLCKYFDFHQVKVKLSLYGLDFNEMLSKNKDLIKDWYENRNSRK